MSKKNKDKKITIFKSVGEAASVITENRNKQGVIKVKHDKKATKKLKLVCPHHKVNKKGKLVPTIEKISDSKCRCTMCGSEIDMSRLTSEDIRKTTNDKMAQIRQAIFMVARLSKKENNHKYDAVFQKLESAAIVLKEVDGELNNVKDIASKSYKDEDGKKKDKGGNKNGGSLSSWVTR